MQKRRKYVLKHYCYYKTKDIEMAFFVVKHIFINISNRKVIIRSNWPVFKCPYILIFKLKLAKLTLVLKNYSHTTLHTEIMWHEE